MTTTEADSATSKGVFSITREFGAPRDLVWEAFAKEEHLLQWWGPAGFTMLQGHVDFRAGGEFFYGMRSPDGLEMWAKWRIREIDAPSRLTIISSFCDADGNFARHPGAPEWPVHMLSTMTLEARGDRTLLTVTGEAYEATPGEQAVFDAGHDSMREGFTGTLNKLDAHVAAMRRG